MTCVLALSAARIATDALALYRESSKGYNAMGNVVAEIVPQPSQKETGQQARDAYSLIALEQMRESVSSLPNVVSVTAATAVPLGGFSSLSPMATSQASLHQVQPEGYVAVSRVLPNYFHQLNIALQAGRLFTSHPDIGEAVINEEAARVTFHQSNPVGQFAFLSLDDGSTAKVQVIGVIHGVRQEGLDKPIRPEIYLPISAYPEGMFQLVVKVRGNEETAGKEILAAIKGSGVAFEVARITSLGQMEDASTATQRFNADAAVALGCIALLMAGVGLTGIVALWIDTRRRDLAIRLALGSSRSRILELLGSFIGKISLVSVLSGIVVMFMIRPFLISILTQKVLFEESSVFVACVAIVTVVGASMSPTAIELCRLDPAQVLKEE
ncbi:hypothetical protein GCM10011585_33420 [Edaphobacter dinghuensis]|uniref:ABC transport system permease protein n=1 Tax=Edaphobacter dinghuensis TaxID=1560005 RepID=A0A917M9R0_9BACT|nr:hypothetical protein GCM10011585_33420 [Edaphobacter dinghuensis]